MPITKVKLGFDAIEYILKKALTKKGVKGIPTIPGPAYNMRMKQLVDEMAKKMRGMGYDVNKVTEKQVQGLLNYAEAMEKQKLKNIQSKFYDPSGKMKPEGEAIVKKGLEGLGKKKDVPDWTKGWTPTIVPKKPKMGKINYKEMEKKLGYKLRGDETFDELLALERKGLLDPEDFASGGIARVGMMIGGFTKAQVLIQMLKNTLKGSKDAYVKKTFPNFIKELQKNPELALDENVWKQFTTGLPKNQRLVVHSDDSVDFFTQSEFGPHNIEKTLEFQKKHNLSRDQANKILQMEPEDRVLEMKRLETIRNRTKQASGGIARVGYVGGGLIKLAQLKKMFPRIHVDSLLEASRIKDPKKLKQLLNSFRKTEQSIDAAPSSELFHFDTTGRRPNAYGGIAGQLHLNRSGFEKGKKVDLSKRKFMKGAGAGLAFLATLPGIGKFFKPAKVGHIWIDKQFTLQN